MTPIVAPAATLCAGYRIRIVERVTSRTVCDITDLVASGTWRRVLQNVSTVEITADTGNNDDPGGRCCDCIPRLWVDDIVIERTSTDGRVEGVVWRGPAVQVIDDEIDGTITITAADNSIWWTRHNRARTSITGTVDEAELWWRLVADAEAGVFSMLSIPGPSPTGQAREVTIEPATDTTEGSDNQILIFGGLPTVMWTVVDRVVYGPGPTTVGDVPFAALDTARHWVDPGAVIDNDGVTFASQVRLVAADSTGAPIVGIYPPDPVATPAAGEHVITYRIDGIYTQAALTAAARRRWESDRSGARYLVTSTSSLSETAPVTVWDLIPGRVFTVTAGRACSNLDGLMRLYNVAVEFTSTGDGTLTETRVAIDFRDAVADRGSSQARISI